MTTIHNSTKNYMKNVILGHRRSAGNKILIFKVACFLVKIRVQWLEQAEKHGCHSRNGWLTARDLSVKIRSAMPTLSWEMVQPTKWTVLEQAFLTGMQLTINLWAVNTVWCPAKSMRDPQATSTWTLQTLQQQKAIEPRAWNLIECILTVFIQRGLTFKVLSGSKLAGSCCRACLSRVMSD